MAPSRSGGALRVLLQIVRAQDAGNRYDFQFAPQDYILPTEGGDSPSARFEWTKELLGELHAVQLPGRDPELLQRIGERLRDFLKTAGWEQHEREIVQAAAERRRIVVTVRSSAAEMYALPWELLTLKSGQYLGEVDGLLLRYEWPESSAASEQPMPRPEGGRIVIAWSAAAGTVPASEHIRAIAAACAAGHLPFSPDKDVIPNASLARIAEVLQEAQESGPPIAVLHLLCHGGKAGSSFGLCLEGEEGAAVVDAAELRQALAPFAAMVRMVVLSACDSGNTGPLGSRLGSLAQTLHRCGYQTVVASRFPLSVAGSTTLTQGLFGELVSGPASLESALLAARRKLARVESRQPRELRPLDWASVQLYSHHAEGEDTRPVVIRPYRGLAAFQPEHRGFFFGRDREIKEIVSDLQALVERNAARFLLVTGASGIGKSSLVLAGVVPALLAAEPELVFLRMRPGSDPARSLRETLAALPPSAKALLVVDQLEEIFTQTRSAASREEFVKELWTRASAPDPGLRVLLTMQVDFIGRCGELTVNNEGLRLDRIAYDEDHRCFIVQPDPDPLRAAIVEPAHKVGLDLEAGLAERILLEVGKEPGAMPLLQDVLDALWKRREGRMLTQAAYDALGGVVGALQNRADTLLDTLAQRGDLPLAQRLLCSLVAVSSDTALDTRLRMPITVLRAQAGDLVARFDRVLEELVTAGLLVQSEDGQAATAEIAHETLIRRWPRLRTWLAEDRASLVVQQRVRQAAREWEQSGDESLLYRGTQLAWAAEWRKTWSPRIGELEQRFLDASAALRIRTRQEAEERLQKEREAAERIRQLLLNSYVERGYKLLDSESGTEESLLWLLRAYQQGCKNAVLPYLLRRAMQPIDARRAAISRGANIVSAAISPDDRWVVLVSETGSAWIAEADSGLLLRELGPARDAVFSPEGQRILLCGDTGAQVWEAATGRILVEIGGSFRNASFSLDGRRVFALDTQNTFHSFDSDSGRALASTPSDDRIGTILACDPTGRLLAVTTGPEYEVELRERESGARSVALVQPPQRVLAAAFSADGQRLFVVTKHEVGIVLDVHSGHSLAQFDDVVSTALSPTTFCPAGRRIVLAGRTGCVTRVCDAVSGAVLGLLRGHTRDVHTASFSPSGRRIVSCGWDETARIYDAALGAPIREQPTTEKSLRSAEPAKLSSSPGGRYRLTQGTYFSVDVVAAEGGQLVATLGGHGDMVSSAQFSPDGRRILTTSYDGSARLYDAEHFGILAVLLGHRGPVYQAWFDAAGRQVVTVAEDGAARIFDAETGYLLGLHTVPAARITDAAFSADARSLITLCSDGTERVFDITPERRSAEELGTLISRRALLRFESDSSPAPIPNLWE